MPQGSCLETRLKNLRARAGILRSARRFFEDNGFIEVETPHRIPVPIPESHIDLLTSGAWVLHPSPEICMKRLMARGFDRIFQLCRCWRDGERGSLHLPEFTMLEWYRAHGDYTDLMKDCEGLIRATASSLGLGRRICRGNREISLDGPWERLTVREAFSRHGGMEMEEALARDLFDEIMVCRIEPLLGVEKPAILMDYPAVRGSLARLKPGEPDVAERFELYIGGLELANGFSELADPEEQRLRFNQEREYRRQAGKPVHPLPEKFLADLASMPPSAGIALGVDRLAMLLLDAERIDEVVAFTPEEL